jgi:hypothetical protein
MMDMMTSGRFIDDNNMVQQLLSLLTRLSSPVNRLRAACFGKKLRENPLENGLINGSQVLLNCFKECGVL